MGNHQQAEIWRLRAVELEPASASLRYDLGLTEQMLGNTQQALDNFRLFLKLKPGNGAALNNIAWIYATHPDSRFRNGAKAIELLEPLAAKSDDDPAFSNLLDTLAAAYAEAGRFDDAVRTAEAAVKRADEEQSPPESPANLSAGLPCTRASSPFATSNFSGPPALSKSYEPNAEKHK